MSPRTFASGFALLSLAVGCGVTNTGNPNSQGAPEGAAFVRSALKREAQPNLAEGDRDSFGADNRAFAFALYGELKDEPGNLFFSPYSISTALAMTYAGAKGATHDEMQQALHFGLGEPTLHVAFNATDLALAGRKNELAGENPEGNGFTLDVTNASFAQAGRDFVDSYLDVLARNYGAGMYRVDFSDHPDQKRMLINDWVADQTAQRIEELLPKGAIAADTALVLVNAIYFKASWLEPFHKSSTEDATFHAPSGDVTVPMMHRAAEQYVRGSDYQAVALPYLSDAVRMLILLPDEGAFEAVEARLDNTLFSEVQSGLSRHSVNLKLPRFSFRSEVKLASALQKLGMQRAFTGEADLSGISGLPGELYIDEVYHQGFVAVDEEGTEAAAATASVIREHSAPPPAEFFADRPFLFFVYDQPAGQVLFTGRLVQPEG